MGEGSIMDRERHLGLTAHVESKSDPGYTLFTPFGHQTTYLVDMEGRVVHRCSRGDTTTGVSDTSMT